jgi:hypothetical protein
MIVMIALFPLIIIDSLPFGTKILKIGEKMLELWSSWVLKMSGELHTFTKYVFFFFVGNKGKLN